MIKKEDESLLKWISTIRLHHVEQATILIEFLGDNALKHFPKLKRDKSKENFLRAFLGILLQKGEAERLDGYLLMPSKLSNKESLNLIYRNLLKEIEKIEAVICYGNDGGFILGRAMHVSSTPAASALSKPSLKRLERLLEQGGVIDSFTPKLQTAVAEVEQWISNIRLEAEAKATIEERLRRVSPARSMAFPNNLLPLSSTALRPQAADTPASALKGVYLVRKADKSSSLMRRTEVVKHTIHFKRFSIHI